MQQFTQKPGKFFILSAPTGTGKTTITTNVLSQLTQEGYPISRVVTYTTRKPRPTEINGKDYFFVSEQEFIKKKQNNFFLETTEYADYHYGSPASIITDMQNGKSFIIIVDKPGVNAYLKLIPDAVTMWITVSDINFIKQRLAKRKGTNEKELEKRFDIAKNEADDEKKNKSFKYHILNDILQDAIQETIQIIKDELK